MQKYDVWPADRTNTAATAAGKQRSPTEVRLIPQRIPPATRRQQAEDRPARRPAPNAPARSSTGQDVSKSQGRVRLTTPIPM